MQDVVQRVHMEWQRLRNQFRWTFVEDEVAFLDTIVRDLSARGELQTIDHTAIRVSIQQHYNRELYQAFIYGRTHLDDDAAVAATNRACQEIYLNALRQVRSKGYDLHSAEEIAQKVVVRLIEKPYAVREPGCLSAWIRWQILDLLKAIHAGASEVSLSVMSDQSELPEPEMVNLTQQLEDELAVEHVLNQLPKILSAFQQHVIQLVVLEERSAIEAAAILDVKPSKVRVEKARAIHKIRQHMANQW